MLCEECGQFIDEERDLFFGCATCKVCAEIMGEEIAGKMLTELERGV